MNWLDLIWVVLIVVFAIRGAMRGFFKEGLGLTFLVFSLNLQSSSAIFRQARILICSSPLSGMEEAILLTLLST